MKRVLGFVLSAALLTGSCLAAFPDVDSGAAYAEAVEYLDSIGIMSGDQNGRFNPDATVTRAEMAAIVCRMLGETDELPARNDFPDVPVGHWANGYVSKAAELGIVNGYDSGLFGPTDKVTYEQAVTMIVRTLYGTKAASESGGYPDGYLSVATASGMLEGCNFRIGTHLTRANVAVLIQNAYTG